MSSEVAWAVKRVHRKTGETQWYTGCGQWTHGWRNRFLDDLRPVFGLQEFKRWRPTHRIVRVTVTRVVKPKRIVFEVGDKVTINELRITGDVTEVRLNASDEWIARVQTDIGHLHWRFYELTKIGGAR